VDHDRWEKALITDLQSVAEITPGRTITSIFFGGGTPSLMPPNMVEKILAFIPTRWAMDPHAEITLEANPTSVEQEKFTALKAAGINRVSLGIQSLDPASLKFLGRQHSATEALGAMEAARKTFDNFSFDLIYTRPGQTVESWQRELDQALDFGPKHLSLYQLTIEEGTPFYLAWHRGDFQMPDAETSAELFEFTNAYMGEQGLPPYEISNYAQPGFECRHNLTYWRYEDYAGVGPGAHSRLTLQGKKYAMRRHRSPEKWLQDIQEKGTGLHKMEALSPDVQHDEYVMMGLRVREGINLKAYETQMGQSLLDVFSAEKIKALEGEGLLHLTAEALSLTTVGRQRLNQVLGFLK
jgi:putative oxygen-independent coproporphyrinogen III oxidase